MQDATAKAVVTFLVNEVRGVLNTELSVTLSQEQQLDELFQEKEDVTDTRQAAHAKLKVSGLRDSPSPYQHVELHSKCGLGDARRMVGPIPFNI